MMRRMIGRYKGCRRARMGRVSRVPSAMRVALTASRIRLSLRAMVRPRGGAVKPSLAPVRNEMLNTSGSRRIMQENLVKATERDRRWYATTAKNVLDRAGDQQVREAA